MSNEEVVLELLGKAELYQEGHKSGREKGLTEAALFVAKVALALPNDETGDKVMLMDISIQLGEIK